MAHFEKISRLEWHQPKAGTSQFHLMSNNEPLGVLHASKGGGTTITFTGPLGTWEAKTQGFWNPDYSLRESARQIEIACTRQKWHGMESIIQISNGPQFAWKIFGCFHRRYSVKDSAGREVVAIRLGLESRKSTWRDWTKVQGIMDLDAGPYEEKVVLACAVMAWVLVLRNQGTDGSLSAMNAAIIG